MAGNLWKVVNILVKCPLASLEIIEKVREVILEDRRQTIHDVCNHIGLSYRSCQRILADELIMRRIAAKFFLHLLINDQ